MKIPIAALMLAPAVALAQHDHSEHGGASSKPVPERSTGGGTSSSSDARGPSGGGVANARGGEATGDKPWSLGVTYDNAVGTAVFVANDAVRGSSALWANSLSVKGGWKLHDRVSLGAEAAFSWEWTTPDAENGRRWSLADTKVGASFPNLYKEEFTGIALSGKAGLTLPTSIESFTASNITNASLGAGLSRAIGPVQLSYGLGFTKNFNLRAANVRSEDPVAVDGNRIDTSDPFLAGHNFRAAQQAKLCFRRDGDAFCEVAGMNANFSISNSLSASWTIIEGLSLSASWALVNRWSYSPPVDGLSSTLTDSSGARVVDGSGRSGDITSGGLDLTYQINEMFAVSFGFATMGPALTADGKYPRFPFYDFVSPANNLTSWYLDLSASL